MSSLKNARRCAFKIAQRSGSTAVAVYGVSAGCIGDMRFNNRAQRLGVLDRVTAIMRTRGEVAADEFFRLMATHRNRLREAITLGIRDAVIAKIETGDVSGADEMLRNERARCKLLDHARHAGCEDAVRGALARDDLAAATNYIVAYRNEKSRLKILAALEARIVRAPADKQTDLRHMLVAAQATFAPRDFRRRVHNLRTALVRSETQLKARKRHK